VVSNRTAFEVPLRSVANSNIAGRTEVSLEFSTAPAASTSKSKKGRPDELTEIRFYVPGTHTKGDDDDADVDDNKDDDEEVSAAQAFHDLIKEKADIGQVIGDVLVSFSEVNIQTPRQVDTSCSPVVWFAYIPPEDAMTLICSLLSYDYVARPTITKSSILQSLASSSCPPMTCT
jgi:hypothetical protein